MKNGILALNIILLIAVAVLYYLHFNSRKTPTTAISSTVKANTTDSKSFKIAYFEMDSVENSFEMVKDVKNELNKRQQDMTLNLQRLDKQLRDKADEYNSKAANMTQIQSESANNDMLQRRKNLDMQKQKYDQEYEDLYMRRMRDVKSKIEGFLNEYNKSGAYTYIFSYEPSFFYYRDTAYNITRDVVKGLNQLYKKD
jgi:outer membrane protein